MTTSNSTAVLPCPPGCLLICLLANQCQFPRRVAPARISCDVRMACTRVVMYTLGDSACRRTGNQRRLRGGGERTVNRLARMMALTLALVCLTVIGAGIAVAHLLPARLALFQMPQVSGAGLATPGPSLPGDSGVPQSTGPGAATAAGVAASLGGLIASGNLGPRVGALVTDLSTGHVLYSLNPAAGFVPASTTKIATAVAALDTLGPGARFTTAVVLRRRSPSTSGPGGQGSTAGKGPGVVRIVLVGGGDPTLAAGPYPAADYPQPATLRALAAKTAK